MTTPPLEPDDPRLTAYALDELDDPAERAAVEQFLADSPAARDEVEQTRAFAETLAAEYAREQADYQAARASAGTAPNVVPFPVPARRASARWTNVALKIAAVFLVFAGLAAGVVRWRETRSALVATSPPAVEPTVQTAPAPPPLVAASPTGTTFAARATPQMDEHATPPAQPTAAPPAADATSTVVMVPLPAAVPPLAPAPGTPEAPADTRLADNDAPGGASGGVAVMAPAVRRAAVPKPTPKTAARTAVEQRIAAALVRIRRQDGLSADGVVLAAGGLVLTPDFLPPGGEEGTFQATGGAGTFRAVFLRRLGSGGGCLFEIDAHSLAAAALADPSRSQAGPLILVVTRDDAGAVGFLHASSPGHARQAEDGLALTAVVPPGEGTPPRLAFNAAGEFLSVEPLPAATNSRASAGEQQRFRLLSPEDRAILAPLIEAHNR